MNRRLALDVKDEQKEIQGYYSRASTSSLLSSAFVFTVSSSPLLVSLGKAGIAACDALRMPFLYGAIASKTFYTQFCGGETCAQVQETMRKLRQDNIGVVLAYAKEETEASEEAFDRVMQDTLETIDVASSLSNSFVAVKLTALAEAEAIKAHTIKVRMAPKGLTLSPEHETQIENLRRRLNEIMAYSVQKKVKILLDAEQDRYQGSIDALALEVQAKYNKREAYAYSTYQCYLKQTLNRLQRELALAKKEGWVLGAKLVRGAYIASDPRHLIHDTKEDTDQAYNDAMKILFRTKGTETVVASHNQESLDLALTLFPPAGPVAFSQLYGMGAPVTHALLRKLEAFPQSEASRQGGGIRVYSYVPWGTVQESMQYLMRRADENSAMAARGRAERDAIYSELWKRVTR